MENLDGNEIKKIMERLDCSCKNHVEGHGMLNYIDVTECANELLDWTFGKDNYKLPIDVEQVIQKLGMEVVEIDLNDEGRGGRSNRVVGELSVRPKIFGDGEIRRIYIDSKTTLYTQRYALAHEIGHFLINKNRKIFNDEYCIMPLLPKEVEEVVADAFAVALLIPIKTFLREFFEYIEAEKENDKLPIGTEDWIQYLSTSARVSFHYVACGYQQLRCVALWLYQFLRLKKELQDVQIEDEKRKKIEKELEEKEKDYPVLTKEIENMLRDDIVEQLFQ